MTDSPTPEKFNPERRAVYIINRNFQFRFMVWMTAAGVAIGGSFFAAHKYFFASFLRKGIDAGLPSDHVFFSFLSKQEAYLDRIFILTCVLIAGAVVYFSIKLSNKIAGPLYRLHRHMVLVADGKTDSPVAFRDGDYFVELADAYNAQLQKLKAAKKEAVSCDHELKKAPEVFV